MKKNLWPKLKASRCDMIALILGTVLMAGSMAPIPYRFLVAPKGQVYDGTEFWSDDYSAYVSYIAQGQRGKWLVYDTHTSELGFPGIVIHEEYLLWGKATGLFGIDPIYAYHLFRLVLGSVFIYLCWKLIRFVFPQQSSLQLSAFFSMLFVGGLPKFLLTGSPNLKFGLWNANVQSYIPWLTELDVFYRFVSLPHYLLGNIFFVLSLVQFLKIQTRIRSWIFDYQFVILVLLGLATGFFHAVSLVTFYVTLAIYFLIITTVELVIQPRKVWRHIPGYGLMFGSYVLGTCLVLIYFKQLLILSPWSNLSAAWEATSYYFVPLKDLLWAIGPTILLAPLGFVVLVRRWGATDQDYKPLGRGIMAPLVLLSWLLAFFLLFYFSHPFLHISQVRFFQTYLFIPAALLGAPMIVFLAGKAKTRLSLPYALILVFGLGLVSGPTLPLAIQSFSGRFTFFSDFSYLVYPPKDWAQAIYWLRDHTDMDAVVLAAWQGGHHIPFMAGNYVYYGHLWGTLKIEQKKQAAETFFRGGMNVSEARNLLQQGRISYVFWGYEEKAYGGDMRRYLSLMLPVYTTPAVTIYQVKI